MSPAVGVGIVITFFITILSLGMTILIRTIKEGKKHSH